MSDDAAIVKEFLIESYENLDRLDQDLVVLEKDPANRDTLSSIFRTIHTIKGTSGFLAFNQLEAVTHAGENLLSRLRDGLLPFSAEITTGLLAMVDAVREMLKSIEASGKEGARNDQELISKLARLLEPLVVNSAPEVTPSKTEAGAIPSEQSVPNLGEILVKRGAAKVSDVQAAIEQQNAGAVAGALPAGLLLGVQSLDNLLRFDQVGDPKHGFRRKMAPAYQGANPS